MNPVGSASLPTVSVVLPVYNGAEHVGAAIRSILAQTYTDFELIVIDDGSTDNTHEVVEQFTDPRIRLVRQENRGLPQTLNHGIELARGRYIARHDHDDLSLPTRFAKQVAWLESDSECALVGTRATTWIGDTPTTRYWDVPVDDAALRFDLMFYNTFVHSSVMLRKDAVQAVGGYTAEPGRQPEDYELWQRLARHYRMANLPERLVIYREIPGSLSRTYSFMETVFQLSTENLAYMAGLDRATKDANDIAAIYSRCFLHLSGQPDFRRMSALIRGIARSIHAARPGSDVLRRAEWRIWNLHLIWFRYRYPILSRLTPVVRPLKGLFHLP